MKSIYSNTYAYKHRSSYYIFYFLLLLSFAAKAQTNVNLSGRVIDETTNLPLSGATVHIKGTTHEVVTDEKGIFGFITGQSLHP